MNDFEKLKNPEFQERLQTASSPEELLSALKEEGIELSDAELSQVAGGDSWLDPKKLMPQCEACGSYAISVFPIPGCTGMSRWVCHDCGWEKNRTPIG